MNEKKNKISNIISAGTTAILMLLLFCGCSSVVTSNFLDPLASSLKKQTDLQLLYDGAPSLLLMIDGLIANQPENEQLLITGTQAYASYASAVFEHGDKKRAAELSERAKTYGMALLRRADGFKKGIPTSLDDFTKSLSSYNEKNVASLFWAATGWSTWIRYQNGSPGAIADLPRVEQLMLKVLEIDETLYYGGAHVFLGSFYGSLPEIYGGRPDKSREHFERALAIAKRNFLLAQVAYAETYARMTFDRDLFASLLNEVVNHPTAVDDLAAANTLAKQMARNLLNKIDEIF